MRIFFLLSLFIFFSSSDSSNVFRIETLLEGKRFPRGRRRSRQRDREFVGEKEARRDLVEKTFPLLFVNRSTCCVCSAFIVLVLRQTIAFCEKCALPPHQTIQRKGNWIISPLVSLPFFPSIPFFLSSLLSFSLSLSLFISFSRIWMDGGNSSSGYRN